MSNKDCKEAKWVRIRCNQGNGVRQSSIKRESQGSFSYRIIVSYRNVANGRCTVSGCPPMNAPSVKRSHGKPTTAVDSCRNNIVTGSVFLRLFTGPKDTKT